MTHTLYLLIVVLASYLVGALPTAYLITRFVYKVNIFELGSGNMGGTNVARIMGIPWGIATVLIDICKGIMAVYLAQLMIPDSTLSASMLAAVAAIVGHNWSIFATLLYRYYQKEFKIIGGKGAATAFGTMILLLPYVVIAILLITGIGLAVLTRYASLSVLVSFSTALTWTAVWAIRNGSSDGTTSIYLLYVTSVAVLILWRFRENIQRLLAGTERRIGERV
ncbi:MAG: glycerol-3-phosphate acyltransferase [Anaerolineae bacterium]|nr:glycerol-3-phosphate acyltransferase [Anaerolineae bacterium]